jgi:threonine dehydrogenase-like Zn-dependent dehydrogenase
MGVVDEIGPGVKNVRIGDRVVVSAAISCGACEYCQSKRMTLCTYTRADIAIDAHA